VSGSRKHMTFNAAAGTYMNWLESVRDTLQTRVRELETQEEYMADQLHIQDTKVRELEKAIRTALEEWSPVPEGDYHHSEVESAACRALASLLKETKSE